MSANRSVVLRGTPPKGILNTCRDASLNSQGNPLDQKPKRESYPRRNQAAPMSSMHFQGFGAPQSNPAVSVVNVTQPYAYADPKQA